MSRDKLPGTYETKYKSEYLKKKIADDAMWMFIPGVPENMNSAAGTRRIRDNDLLFTFIDQYFPKGPFAFEPNMQDGRYVLLPDDVWHQGIGISVSNRIPGFLEVNQFWYPSEYTQKTMPIGMDQVSVTVFMAKPGQELAGMVQRVYMQKNPKHEHYCTFPFTLSNVVTLRGNFLDRKSETAKTIRDALKDEPAQVQKNGEGLILFMNRAK